MSPAFRDLNHNGTMEPYEDPGRTPAERAEDLLARMTLEEKAGQLFHPMITPGPGGSVTAAPDSLAPEDPADVRIAGRLVSHFNVMQLRSARDAALWHNRLQELAAGTRLGIPVTLSSDPRHTARFVPGATVRADEFSRWPEPAGFAAIGDPGTVERFAGIARREYRAVGISVALHPQADLATEPRWARVSATFGEDADLAARLVAAYVRGFQGEVLGPDSVAAMVKHFPGGGPQKDGDDPHFAYGREQVYPGGNFDYHLGPFLAAFEAGASQVMPSYGVPVGTKYAEEGFAFNREIITGLLRGECGFDGIVCTDWGLVTDSEIAGWPFPARAWGAEGLSREERVLKILDAGADQLGGEECPQVVVALVNSGKLSEERLDESVRRILREKFRLGLFDNPFVDADAALAIVGTPEFRAAGLAAQRASLTLLKNDAGGRPLLPLAPGTKVYLSGVSPALAAEYAEVTDDPAAADLAVVRLDQPQERGGRGSFEQRFHGGTLDFPPGAVEAFAALAARLPAVAVVRLERPLVLPAIAAAAAALVGDFGASDRALLDVLFGRAAPQGRLPFDLPSSMREVLDQKSDVPFDMPNPAYRFGFGLSYPASHPASDPRPQGNDNQTCQRSDPPASHRKAPGGRRRS